MFLSVKCDKKYIFICLGMTELQSPSGCIMKNNLGNAIFTIALHVTYYLFQKLFAWTIMHIHTLHTRALMWPNFWGRNIYVCTVCVQWGECLLLKTSVLKLKCPFLPLEEKRCRQAKKSAAIPSLSQQWHSTCTTA